jgi:hypothetical protein
MLCREIILVYCANHKEPHISAVLTECRVFGLLYHLVPDRSKGRGSRVGGTQLKGQNIYIFYPKHYFLIKINVRLLFTYLPLYKNSYRDSMSGHNFSSLSRAQNWLLAAPVSKSANLCLRVQVA